MDSLGDLRGAAQVAPKYNELNLSFAKSNALDIAALARYGCSAPDAKRYEDSSYICMIKQLQEKSINL